MKEQWNDMRTEEKVSFVAGALAIVGVGIVALIIVGAAFVLAGPIWGFVVVGVGLAIVGGLVVAVTNDL